MAIYSLYIMREGAFGDRGLKRYFTKHGYLFLSKGLYLFPCRVLLLAWLLA